LFVVADDIKRLRCRSGVSSYRLPEMMAQRAGARQHARRRKREDGTRPAAAMQNQASPALSMQP